MKALNEDATYYQIESLSEKDLINEYILTRIRTIWGIKKTEIDQIKPSSFDHCKKLFNKFPDKAIISNEQITLNEQGMLIADRISSELFVS